MWNYLFQKWSRLDTPIQDAWNDYHPSGHFRRIKVGWYFLDHRVELDLRTGEGETSLHLSTRVGYHLDNVRLMVEKGALTDTETNRFGKTTPTLGIDGRHE